MPLTLACLASAVAARLSRHWAAVGKPGSSQAGIQRRRTAAVVVVAGWWLSVFVAVAPSQAVGWLPQEAWRQAFWPILLFGLIVAMRPVIRSASEPRVWVAAAAAATLLAFVTLPHGDGWEDLLDRHRRWMLAVTVSCLLNAWSFDALARSGGQRWVLWVAAAGLIGPLLIAAGAYGTLAEACLAAVTATVAVGTFASVGSIPMLCTATAPAAAWLATATASARFYCFEDHPFWLYLLVLFLPSLVTATDWPLRKQVLRLRVSVAATLCTLLNLFIGWMLYAEMLTWSR